MSKRSWLGLLLVALVCVTVVGCSTVTKELKATVDTVTHVGSSEATLSGTLIYSSGTVDISLNPVLVSGDAKTITTGTTRVRVSTDPAAVLTATPVTVTIPSGTKPIDIAFILDNTGSMYSAISGSKNSIVAFAQSLEAAGVNARFGLVTFGDAATHPTPTGPITAEGVFNDFVGESSPHPRPVMDFTTASALRDKLSAEVFGEGGSDAAENPLDAVMYAYNTFAWRSDAQKVFIVITDITTHQKIAADTSSDNKCTTSLEAVVNALIGKAVVYTVSPNLSYEPYGGGWDVRRLSDGLGGGRATAETCTGGKWMLFDSYGFDLNTLGISSILSKSYTLRFSYTFESGTYYILVEIDTDGDGVYDSNMLIKVTVASGSSVASATFGVPTAKAVSAKDAAKPAPVIVPNN